MGGGGGALKARGAMIPEYAVRELINIHEGGLGVGVGWGDKGREEGCK